MVKNVVQHQPGETWWRKEKKTVNTTPTSNTAFIDLTWLVFVLFPTGISFPSFVFVFAPLDFQRAWGSDAFGEKIENKAHCEHCRAEPLVPYKYWTNTVQIQSTSQLQMQTKLNATVLSKEGGKTRSGGSLVTDSHKWHHWRVFARGRVTLIRGTDLIALLCICARLVFRICVG